MLKLDRNIIIAAYDKMFDKTPFEKYLQPKDDSYSYTIVGLNMDDKQHNKKIMYCLFTGLDDEKIIPDIDYEARCRITFTNVSNEVIEALFKSKNYNYQSAETTIRELAKISMDFNFIKEFTINDLSIDLQFKSTMIDKRTTFRPAGVLTYSSPLVEFDDDFKIMMYKRTINVDVIFIVKNAEIHPLLVVAFPITAKKKHYMYFDLLDSDAQRHEENLLKAKETCFSKMKEHLDFLLTKNLNLNNDDLDNMSLDSKIDYLKVLEMGAI